MPVPPASVDLEFKAGAIEVLVLKSVSWGPMHGYAIARWIQDTTNDALRVEEGSLYPALQRLEDKGAVQPEWGLSENNRKAKFSPLPAAGRQMLRTEAEHWKHYSGAIAKVMATTGR